jgi:hypothetical protein
MHIRTLRASTKGKFLLASDLEAETEFISPSGGFL